MPMRTPDYKMRTKAAHDKLIRLKDFKVGDSVLLYNSKLRLFPGKLRSKWAGPFKIHEVLPYGSLTLLNQEGKEFTEQVLGRKWPTRGTTRSSQEQARSSEATQSSGVLLMAVSLSRPRPCLPVLWGALRSFGAFWSIWDRGAWRDLAHGRSSTGYAKEEGRSHLEDQLDRLLDQPVEFLNSTGQASTRSS
ncbi:unnamed protein product [Microthlaspi erraticum]|uniref:Uncharacterized protein n=1 Tax=Microthlaspi erraticum TaxID=1685480 RepID=A0A6D2JK07_9BRAS|nr:unnamed protein product [Microthlaspi erraticum]